MSQISRRVPRHVLDLQEGQPTRPGPPGRSPDPSWSSGWVLRPVPDFWVGPDPSWTSGWVFRSVPDFWEFPQICPEPPGGCSNPSRTCISVPQPVTDCREGP